MVNSDSGCSERVVPDNGRQETSWLVGSIIIILIFAGITLKFNQQAPVTKTEHLGLDVTGKAVLTALRNAADEISFMSDGQGLPSVEELIDSALPPFADDTGAFSGYRWQKLDADCYYGQNENGSPDFALKFSDHAEIYWYSAGATSLRSCTALSGWQTAHNHD